MFSQLKAAAIGTFLAGVMICLTIGPVTLLAQTKPATLIPTNLKVSTITVTGQIIAPVGTNNAPSYTFAGNTNTGWYSAGAGSGSAIFAANTTRPVQVGGGGLFIAADSSLEFSTTNGNATATLDAGISRLSAGVLGVGTGATGSFAGSIKATTFVSAGSSMAVANVGANSCGTTAATIAGNANAFVVTVGATSGTQCRVAFPVAATTEYDCSASQETSGLAIGVTPVDSTHTDFLATFSAGAKFIGICFPR